jgi:hypothetical protein
MLIVDNDEAYQSHSATTLLNLLQSFIVTWNSLNSIHQD